MESRTTRTPMRKTRSILICGILALAVLSFTACQKTSGDKVTFPAVTAPQVSRDTFLNDKQTVVDAGAAAVSSGMTGTARVVVDPSSGTIAGTMALKNVTGTVTQAHIHDGAAGVNGGVVVALTETSAGSGVWTVSGPIPAGFNMDKFKAAGYYINVHTTVHPAGEIRGQLMSYAENIQPIFDANCISCHASGSEDAAGLFLTKENSHDQLVNKGSTNTTGNIRVIPFDAESSELYQRIAGTGGFTGAARMPKGAAALSVHDQDLIKTWINMGAMNEGGTAASATFAKFTRSAMMLGSLVTPAAVTTSSTGTAIFTLDVASGKLTGSATLVNVTGVSVEIRDGDIGASGDLVLSLTQPSSGNVWTAPATVLTSSQRERFRKAGTYIVVASAANPAGEIRGQLLSYDDNIQPIFDGNCAECHRVGGQAGSGGLSILTNLLLSKGDSYASIVNKTATQSTGDIRVLPLDGEISVLFERIAGTNGFDGLLMMPKNGGAIPARDQDLIRVWIDMGAMNGAGVPAPIQFSQFVRKANLSNVQITPVPVTTATGTASFALDVATKKVTGSLFVTNPSSTVTAAHIHEGDIGVNGGVAVGLTQTAPGVWSATSSALTSTQRNSFRKAGLYVNVHTANNAGGEIRGQLMSYAGNVQAIFDRNCTGCHAPGSPSDFTGLELTPSVSYSKLVNQPNTQTTGTRVIPGDASNSMLYKRDSGVGLPANVFQMPPNGPFLPEREKEIIKLWINTGAPND